jgi:L-ascorbate metabolism protein UlaG (beta-lactamase superfamily)
MEFQFHGANCVSIITKKATFVLDDNLAGLGAKSVIKPDMIALFTQIPAKAPDARLVIQDPGEYEASEISIFGVGARAHMDEKGTKNATIYKIQTDDLKVAFVGHIHPDITEDEVAELGMIDILFIPVGGSGYTLECHKED